MKRLRLGLILVFLLGAAALVIGAVISKPRILVLHSYNPDYSWVRDVDMGLRRVLGTNQRVSLRWHYMDTKRHPWRDYKEKAGMVARQAIEAWQPDIIIAVDDDAQAYAARNYVNHKAINIVFSGVNADLDAYGYDKATNVTGILERQDFDAIKSAMLSIAASKGMTGPVRVMSVGDTSETVEADAKSISAYDWSPLQFVGTRLVPTLGDWQKAVEAAEGQTDFILTTNYRGLTRTTASRELVPPREVVEWSEAHSKPMMIGTYGFYVEDGGTLAIATSPYEQGEVAARKALKIIAGTAPRDIPVTSTEQFVVFMRGAALQARGISLPPIYEAFARATKNYYE
jgi:ABC-type uncharacterized transport system substrate-binding protein